MPILLWETRFELGIPQFDEHHRHLVDLLNAVYQASIDDSCRGSLGAVVRNLVEYAQYHFAVEEEAMTVSGYTGQAQHRAEHEQFGAMVEAFQHELAAGQDISTDLLSFLGNWLFDHILLSDAQYCSALRQPDDTREIHPQ